MSFLNTDVAADRAYMRAQLGGVITKAKNAAQLATMLANPSRSMSIMSLPPTVTVGTGTSTINGNTNGAVTIGPTSDRVSQGRGGLQFLQTINGTDYYIPNQASAGIKFVFYGSKFEFVMYGQVSSDRNGNYSIKIDGQFVTADLVPQLSNGHHNILVDFGTNTDTLTFAQLNSIAAGGTGYAVGDTITLVGGTGTAATFAVTAVSSGVVTKVRALTKGAYSVIPSGPIATTTSGSGSGLTLNLYWGRDHSTIAPHEIELFMASNSQFAGLNIAPTDAVIAAPYRPFKMSVIGDSITKESFTYQPGRTWVGHMAETLGVDNLAQIGTAGIGYLRQAGGQNAVEKIATYLSACATDDAVFVALGRNDSSYVAADIQAQVTTFFNLLYAGLPDAIIICGNAFQSAGEPTTAQLNAIRDGFLASQDIHDPSGLRSGYADTVPEASGAGTATNQLGTGPNDHLISSDAVHPHDAGHLYLGRARAVALIKAMKAIADAQ